MSTKHPHAARKSRPGEAAASAKPVGRKTAPEVAQQGTVHDPLEAAAAIARAAAAITVVRELDLVGCTVKPVGADWHIELLVDRMPGRGGITLDECAEVSRALSAQIDAPPALLGNYELDVGSPGSERPLRHGADMARFIGTNAKFALVVDGERETVIGEIAAISATASGEVVHVRTGKANAKKGLTGVREIALSTLTAAHLAPTFEQWLAIGKRLAAECPVVQDDSDLIDTDIPQQS